LACRTAFQTGLAEAHLPLTESITVPWAFLCPAAVGMLGSEFGERRELDRVGHVPTGGKRKQARRPNSPGGAEVSHSKAPKHTFSSHCACL